MRSLAAVLLALAIAWQGAAFAQGQSNQAVQKPAAQDKKKPAPTAKGPQSTTPPAAAAAQAPVDPGYVIGPEDVLGVLFWRDQDLSGDVVVRPDGMVTLPLVRDIKAAGLTPTQLADKLQEAVREYVTDASVTVVVKQPNSRKVFITGEVMKPGAYPIGGSTMTVMQLIAVAGGLTEWAEGKSITVMRVENGKSKSLPFDYKNVARGRKAEQNIVLKPGDTVVVPER